MKVVLDTNVLMSGFLNPYGIPGEITHMVLSGTLTICYDARILWEYRQVLLRPEFSFDHNDVDALLEEIESSGYLVVPVPLSTGLPDKSDEPFLEVALAGGAELLITGNVRHYPEDRRRGVRVVSLAEFVELYRKSIDD